MERLGFQEIKTINYYNHRDDIYSKVYYNEILDTIVILDFNITEIDIRGVFSYSRVYKFSELIYEKA